MVVVLEFLWNETRTLTLIHCYDLILGISIFVYNFILEILYTFWKKKSKDQDCDCYRRSLFSVTTNGIQEWHLQHTLRFTAGESLMPVSSLFIRLPRINTMAAALKAWRWPAAKHLSLQHTVSYLELVSVFFNVIHSVPVTYTVHSNLFESLGLNKQNENHYQRQNKHTKDTQKKKRNENTSERREAIFEMSYMAYITERLFCGKYMKTYVDTSTSSSLTRKQLCPAAQWGGRAKEAGNRLCNRWKDQPTCQSGLFWNGRGGFSTGKAHH